MALQFKSLFVNILSRIVVAILAQVVKDTIDSSASIEFKPNTADDPHKRKPDITKAKELLNWEPKVSLREGLPLMVTDFQKRILNEEMRL